MKKKLVLSLCLLSLCFPPASFADSTADSAALIEQLQAQIVLLQQQIQVLLQKNHPSSLDCPKLTYNLYFGLNDTQTEGQVTQLQNYLKNDASVYPEGLVTGYFGPATERSVQLFQTKSGIISTGSPDATGYGAVGPQTRVKIMDNCANSTVPPPVSSVPILTPSPTPSLIAVPIPAPAPSIAILQYEKLPVPSSTLSNGSMILYRFKARVSGNATLNALSFHIISSGASVSNLAVNSYSDPSFSQQAYSTNPIGTQSGAISGERNEININSDGYPLRLYDKDQKYFELAATISGKTLGASVTANLEGLPVEILSGAVPVPSSPLAITSPHSSESWQFDSFHTITWQGLGITPSWVYVQTSDRIGSYPVVSSTDKNSFFWQVGHVNCTQSGGCTTIRPGNYILLIVQGPERVSIPFTISAAAQPTLQITSPDEHIQWVSGHDAVIQWNSTGLAYDQNIDSITLRDATGKEYDFIKNTPNDGWEHSIVPVVPVGSYVLMIRTNVNGQSIIAATKPFQITFSPQVSQEKLPLPTNQLSNGDVILYRLSYTASSSDAVVGILAFTVTTQNVSVANFRVSAYEDQFLTQPYSGGNPVATNLATIAPNAANVPISLEIKTDTPFIVPAFGKRYFELHATLTKSGGPASLTVEPYASALGPQVLSVQ